MIPALAEMEGDIKKMFQEKRGETCSQLHEVGHPRLRKSVSSTWKNRLWSSSELGRGLSVLSILVLVSACTEITLPANESDGIHVSGSSTVQAPPDIATMQVGVQTFAAKAEEAVAENNGKVEATIASLLEKGVAEADIQTDSFNISPQREYKANRPPVVIGFNVSNMLSVKIRNLDRVGKILQATIDVGANNVYGLTFSIEDPTLLKQQARKLAIEDAQARAEVMATAAGVTVGKPIRIQETSWGGPIVRSDSLEKAAVAADVPIQPPGEIDLTINLQVVFEIR